MQNIDIESLIPHRSRIKVIEEVLNVEADTAQAAATVNHDWPLCEDNAVNSLILIEVVAQTAAVIDGIKRKRQGKQGGKGWLVGVKSAHFHVAKIDVGTRLVATVSNSYSFDNYSVIKGTVRAGEEIIAVIILQALRMNEDPTND